MEYLLLMRGINVGGNHHVPMAELRQQLTDSGLTNVKSYINSGNLVFAGADDWSAVNSQIRTVLQDHYDWEIPFVVLNQAEVDEMIQEAPKWWGQRENWRHNTLFKLPGYEPEYDQLVIDKATDDYDRVSVTKHAIFWSSPAKTNFSRALYAKMLSEPFYPVVSIRNRNTTLKLAQMMAER